jgi:ribosomal protein S27AE
MGIDFDSVANEVLDDMLENFCKRELKAKDEVKWRCGGCGYIGDIDSLNAEDLAVKCGKCGSAIWDWI